MEFIALDSFGNLCNRISEAIKKSEAGIIFMKYFIEYPE